MSINVKNSATNSQIEKSKKILPSEQLYSISRFLEPISHVFYRSESSTQLPFCDRLSILVASRQISEVLQQQKNFQLVMLKRIRIRLSSECFSLS